MKSLLFVVLYCSAISCQQEEPIIKQGNITFSLSKQVRSGGRTTEVPTPAFVLLTVKKPNGDVVIENKKLSLFSFGQEYVSESLELNTGTYQLTQFMILEAADKIIYATPIEGSALAQYVSDPLPIEFTIAGNGSTQIVPQVLAVDAQDTPESFGYVSFGFEVVGTDNTTSGSRLKTLFSYGYNNECQCFIPSSKITFVYNNAGKPIEWNVYANFNSANGYKHYWRDTIEYFPEQSFYRETVFSVNTNEVHSTREVYYDQLNKVTSVKNYTTNEWGVLKLSGVHKYEYNPSGYTIEYLIGTATSGGAKIAYEVSANNPVHVTHYAINGSITGESFISYDTKLNPFNAFFPLINFSNSYNNILSYTSGVYVENYSYVYSPEGNVLERVMSASNEIIEKQVYEY